MVLGMGAADHLPVEVVEDRLEPALAVGLVPARVSNGDRLERRPASCGSADQRRTSPNRRQIGIRGTIPRRAYRPFEIGCTASVHMPQVWIPLSKASSGPGTPGPPGSTSVRPGRGP